MGLLRRMLEGALTRLGRVGDAFGRYKKATGASIAELSFALAFAQAEIGILTGRLDAALGEASTERVRADDLDRDNRNELRRFYYVDNPDTPSRFRSVAYDQCRRLGHAGPQPRALLRGPEGPRCWTRPPLLPAAITIIGGRRRGPACVAAPTPSAHALAPIRRTWRGARGSWTCSTPCCDTPAAAT